MANPLTNPLLMLFTTISRIPLLLLTFVLCLTPIHAELSQKQARKAISKAGGMSLPSSSIRVESIVSDHNTAEVASELQLVFRSKRDEAGQWRLEEVRTAEANWENVDLIARAANVELSPNRCNEIEEIGRTSPEAKLTSKLARCLIAHLFSVALPSDAVRVKEISGLALGPQPSALVVSVIRANFRLAKESSGWQVVEFRSGTRPWVNLSSFVATIDSLRRTKTMEEMNAIVVALEAFRRARGSFVVSDQHAGLIDNLAPHYLHRVMRTDSWQRPYRYQGERDHFTLRSLGPDGKENTADDIVLSR